MATIANTSCYRPGALSHTPFLGLRTSVLPCLRDFRSPTSALGPVIRHRICISCVASSSGRDSRHPKGLPQAHITALDNRAGVEDLLSLLRSKQPGKIDSLFASTASIAVPAPKIVPINLHSFRSLKWARNCISSWHRAWGSWSANPPRSAAHANSRCCAL